MTVDMFDTVCNMSTIGAFCMTVCKVCRAVSSLDPLPSFCGRASCAPRRSSLPCESALPQLAVARRDARKLAEGGARIVSAGQWDEEEGREHEQW